MRLMINGYNLSCNRNGKNVVSNFSFSVEEGEILTLLGPNGSGKTSLLLALAGYLPISHGSLFWGNINLLEDVKLFREYQKSIDLLLHKDQYIEKTSVSDYISFWSEINGLPYNNDEILDTLGIYALKEFPINSLSLGQKKRISLAHILLGRKSIWLLDEPLIGLDNQAISLVKNLLLQHQIDGGLAIVSTHQKLGIKDEYFLCL